MNLEIPDLNHLDNFRKRPFSFSFQTVYFIRHYDLITSGSAIQNIVEFFVKVFRQLKVDGFFNFGTIPNFVYQKITYL